MSATCPGKRSQPGQAHCGNKDRDATDLIFECESSRVHVKEPVDVIVISRSSSCAEGYQNCLSQGLAQNTLDKPGISIFDVDS